MARFAAPGGPVRAVPVHKRRVRYTIGGCTAELSEVTAAGRSTRTLAVESEDAAAVIAAVRGLGLGTLGQHQLPARPGGAGRRHGGALCGDRRRHQLDQVHRR